MQAILDYINNWFVKDVYQGTFTVEDGKITTSPGLQLGQYYKIVGSVFNDGLHQWHLDDLIDETFTGELWALAVPVELVNLSNEIEDWCSANQKVLDSPYKSESFGGYSYTRAENTSGKTYVGADAWKTQFGASLNAWRKI